MKDKTFIQKYFTEGTYTKQGATFSNDASVTFHILTRKATTPNKPKHYILAKIQGKDYYLSSMYPTPKDNVFRVEYAKTYYNVFDLGNEIEVKEVKK